MISGYQNTKDFTTPVPEKIGKDLDEFQSRTKRLALINLLIWSKSYLAGSKPIGRDRLMVSQSGQFVDERSN